MGKPCRSRWSAPGSVKLFQSRPASICTSPGKLSANRTPSARPAKKKKIQLSAAPRSPAPILLWGGRRLPSGGSASNCTVDDELAPSCRPQNLRQPPPCRTIRCRSTVGKASLAPHPSSPAVSRAHCLSGSKPVPTKKNVFANVTLGSRADRRAVSGKTFFFSPRGWAGPARAPAHDPAP